MHMNGTFYEAQTLAAGCSTSRSFRIVAPSLVMVTSPMSSTSICSIALALRQTLKFPTILTSSLQPHFVQPHWSQRTLHDISNSSHCGDILASHVLTGLSASLDLQGCTLAHRKTTARRHKTRKLRLLICIPKLICQIGANRPSRNVQKTAAERKA